VNVHGHQGAGGRRDLRCPDVVTTSGGGDLCTARSDTYLNGRSVAVPFAAPSVQTLRMDGVTVQ
jgi:galactan endo-1,6-beta-galactosidase